MWLETSGETKNWDLFAGMKPDVRVEIKEWQKQHGFLHGSCCFDVSFI